jgi:hypothetical protein
MKEPGRPHKLAVASDGLSHLRKEYDRRVAP